MLLELVRVEEMNCCNQTTQLIIDQLHNLQDSPVSSVEGRGGLEGDTCNLSEESQAAQ